MNRSAKTLLAITLLGMSTGSAVAEIAVIVDSSVSVDSVNMEQLERLYLGKPANIQASTRLTPVDQKKGSELRKEFAQKVLGKSEAQLSRYWSRLMFSGKGQPPRDYDGDAAVIREVTGNPGRLGYVSADAVTEDTKVIMQIP
jgi:ABC-type phosphate transport system substrate-binding protein